MPTAFESFVQAELPNRQVLFSGAGNPATVGVAGTIGTYYLDTSDNYKRYEKTGSGNNDWVAVGSGSTETVTHVLPGGAFAIDTPGAGEEREYLALSSGVFGGDAKYDSLNYSHILILPYDTTVKKVLLRSAGSQNDDVTVGIHSNRDGVTSTELKFFVEEPLEDVTHTFTNNNETAIFTYAEDTSANAGETLGLSISGTSAINATTVTMVLEYDKTT